MNIFEQVYLQIINEATKEVVKHNDFPEDKNIKTDITSKLQKFKYIDKVYLTGHCAKSVKDDGSIHGINYLNIPKWKFFESINIALNQLFLEYDIKFLMKNLYRFQILIHIKSLKRTFLLAFENEQNEYVNSINIVLITIFEKDKISNDYTYTKYGMKKSNKLKDIYIESKNEKQLIWLNNIIY